MIAWKVRLTRRCALFGGAAAKAPLFSQCERNAIGPSRRFQRLSISVSDRSRAESRTCSFVRPVATRRKGTKSKYRRTATNGMIFDLAGTPLVG